ncbi:nuclear transport factor 2 family protein [Alloscardovia macacae]|uniref:nuclear transport factor 2 family protein n=1 Tax=Alloscardovia macacae TaxID=1160091 RepID=UPI001FCEE3DB|nr:nuclear transport factor 2 family protein [Alloscardovia macacae]
MFASGDAQAARELLADGYIQHNLAYDTGADAFVGAVEYLASAPVKTTVQNVRAFEDGDKVVLQTVYNFAGAGEQVAFDVFRFDENGKIAEHWDNLAALAPANPSGHTQIDSPVEAADLEKTEENRAVVQNFLHDVMQGISMVYDTVHQVLAQGNMVLAISEGSFGGAPTSYYDLWRVEDGKIAEHWDVMETIADKATWQNENGKF